MKKHPRAGRCGMAGWWGPAFLPRFCAKRLLPCCWRRFHLLTVGRWLRWSRFARPGLFRWLGSQTLRYYVPLGLFFALYLGMRINACGLMTNVATVHPMVNLLVRATPLERLVTPFELLARYLALTLWPAHLSADYSAPSILPTANPFSPAAAIGILVCLLGLILSLKTWPRAAVAAAGRIIPHVLLCHFQCRSQWPDLWRAPDVLARRLCQHAAGLGRGARLPVGGAPTAAGRALGRGVGACRPP